MWNWLRNKLGISDCEKGITCLHMDVNKAFNRIEAITLAVGKKRVEHFHKRIETRESQRYDEIQREQARKRHRKTG